MYGCAAELAMGGKEMQVPYAQGDEIVNQCGERGG